MLAASLTAHADVLDIPKAKAGVTSVPLLVVLHGDGERAETAAARWRAAAADRGWALFAPQCPAAEGCSANSWWKWDGDPAWLENQVKKVRDRASIDAASIALVGWSGGGTYLGRRAPAWKVFSVAVVHGGGDSPAGDTCPSPALPTYFLVGDRNPLHALAADLRAYLVRCKQDVTWDVIAGGDHEREDRALDRKKATAILDWAAAHARPRR